MVRHNIIRLLLTAFLAATTGCSTGSAPLPTAAHVDPARYAGRWYVIANIPYFAEKGKVGSFFEVSFDGDRVTDLYRGRDGSFAAELGSFTMRGYIVPGTGNAVWRESPVWPLYFSYLILNVDADYQTALVGYPGRGYGWLLSRAPQMDDATYQHWLGRFAALGYDPTLFRRVPQSPDQIGKPGFQ
jgi:apolipoprotein D and lipocalin family protein